ncbi:MAG: hypothetical protein KAV43_05025, partial [Hadesarchaea archaeon]|nr:hypothetical protein [Hadesarchaea archaeon]
MPVVFPFFERLASGEFCHVEQKIVNSLLVVGKLLTEVPPSDVGGAQNGHGKVCDKKVNDYPTLITCFNFLPIPLFEPCPRRSCTD